MFKFISRKPNLTVDRLIRTIRDIRLSNAIIEESEYMSGLGYNKVIVKLDKVNIIDIIKIDSSSKEEQHNVEIKLIDDNLSVLSVYKSPTIYVREENYGKLLIKANVDYSCLKTSIKNNVVKWSIKGNWCDYIVSEINGLELEINSRKFKRETEEKKREEEIKKEKSDKVKSFNSLFKEN